MKAICQKDTHTANPDQVADLEELRQSQVQTLVHIAKRKDEG